MNVKAINGLSVSSFQGRTQNHKKEKQVHASREICPSDPFRTLCASDDHHLPHEPV